MIRMYWLDMQLLCCPVVHSLDLWIFLLQTLTNCSKQHHHELISTNCLCGNVGGELLVQSVPPLGSIEFQMRDRNLPPIIEIELRVDSSLEALGITEEEAQVNLKRHDCMPPAY